MKYDNDYISEDHHLEETIGKIAGIILGIILCALLGGCRSVCGITNEDFIHITDTVVINRLQYDSIHVKDSIYVKEWQKGDTVYLTTDHYLTRYKERISHDSLYIHLTDTVRVTVPVEVATKKTLWQEMSDGLSYMGIGSILTLVGLALFFWYKGK